VRALRIATKRTVDNFTVPIGHTSDIAPRLLVSSLLRQKQSEQLSERICYVSQLQGYSSVCDKVLCSDLFVSLSVADV
jgi:hypothetical protein